MKVFAPLSLLVVVVLSCATPQKKQQSRTIAEPVPSVQTTLTPTQEKKPSPARLLEKRKAYIELHERSMLDQGYDFYFSLRGKNKDELEVKYVLMSRPFVYKFTQEYREFMSGLRDIGFTKIHFTDGYDEKWTVDL